PRPLSTGKRAPAALPVGPHCGGPVLVRQTLGRTTRVPAAMSLAPEQAVEVAKILRARRVVPIHYGQSNPGYAEVPYAVGVCARAAKAAGLGHAVLAPGATLD